MTADEPMGVAAKDRVQEHSFERFVLSMFPRGGDTRCLDLDWVNDDLLALGWLTRILEEPEHLLAAGGDVADALFAMPDPSGVMGICACPDLPLEARLRAVRAQALFFRKLGERPECADALFMWWERLPGAMWRAVPSNPTSGLPFGPSIREDFDVCQALVPVLLQIGLLPIRAMALSALHGLGEFEDSIGRLPMLETIERIVQAHSGDKAVHHYAASVKAGDCA